MTDTKHNLFHKLQEVKHAKTGNIYRIYKTPRTDARLEHNNETYYQYKGDDKVWWIRCKSEMEDGRFIAIKSSPLGLSEAAAALQRLGKLGISMANTLRPFPYEPELYDVLHLDGKKFKCFVQVESMSADGSYCDGCAFNSVYPSAGTIVARCSIPSHLRPVCRKEDRKDNTRVIFVEIA